MKYENDHTRALALLAASAIESLSDSDALWLASHLRDCVSCEGVRSTQYDTINVFKRVPVRTPVFLAARTKARVRSRMRELEESRQRMRLLIVSSVLALGWTIALAPLLWKFIEWAGGMSILNATIVWSIAIAWFWAAPALAGVALVMAHRDGQNSLFRSAIMRRLGHE